MLQEVDNFTRFYKSELIKLGYELLYRTKENFNKEGCALGFKTEIFDLQENSIIKFDEGHPYEKDYEYRRGNIAIHAKLKHKVSQKIIHVICTHLFWDPNYEHIKYLQMSLIMKHIDQHIDKNEIIIWGGDLNSMPQHNLIQYVMKGLAPDKNMMEGSGTSNIQVITDIYNNLKNFQKHEWDNPYRHYGKTFSQPENEYPKYTDFVIYFKGTIDHIFFKKGALRPTKILKIPNEEEIKNKSLPNRRFPSDHLPIMAEFEIL